MRPLRLFVSWLKWRQRLNISYHTTRDIQRIEAQLQGWTWNPALPILWPHWRHFYWRVWVYIDLICDLWLTCILRLIAVMLGRLRFSISQAISAYERLAPKMFEGTWRFEKEWLWFLSSEVSRTYCFRGENMVQAIQDLLATKGLNTNMMMRNSSEIGCKT
jgi:hypothetical protein